ncbi:MAG: insulinase family protein [Bacteroidetes bacterium]|nr:insulinase family protein [Bacteroidota bacterium]
MKSLFMKHQGALLLIFSLLLTAILASSSPAQQLVELPIPKLNKVVIKLQFRNGSICDPKGKEGLTYATANLITQGGTKELSYSEIQDKIYPWAAGYGALVDKEVTTFTFQVPAEVLDQFYPILKGLLLEPAFAENDFHRIMKQQQNYVDQVIRASSDEEYSKKALEDFLFRGTNYQHMVQGTSEDVKNISLDDIKMQYKNFFTRNNLTIGIAGNYSPKFLASLKADMAKLSNVTPVIPPPGKAKMPDGVNVEIIAKEGAFGSAIFTGTPLAVTRSDNDFAALMVANSYLGEHRKSYGVLYNKIRETRSMNYGDYSYIEWYQNGGGYMLPPPGVPRHSNYFSIWIRPVQIAVQLQQQYPELKNISIGHAQFALRLAVREVEKIIHDGISPEAFEATRTFLRSYIKLYVATPSDQLGYLMDSKFYGRTDYIKEMDHLLAKLTVKDVNNAVKKYWRVNNMDITIVTDTSEAEPLAKSLKENLPSPMSYSNAVKAGLPKSVLEEDELIAAYNLRVKHVTIIDSKETFK